MKLPDSWLRRGRQYRPVQEFLSSEETTHLILTLFRQHPHEVRFAGQLLGIDSRADDAVLYARVETFFRGVRFRPEVEDQEKSFKVGGHTQYLE
ncbi:MAG TPA: hypothetical protein VH593_31725 [Ktedonobacteraceae bacterium]